MSGDNDKTEMALPDPRIPYDPLNEGMRFEAVWMQDGSLRCSFPPPQADALFWKFYALLSDLAKSHYGYAAVKDSLITRGVPPPPRFHP
jgi:hypothetical protein